MAWIESHQGIGRHPKTRKLARRLGISIPTVIGHLHLFWWWAMDYAPDGNVTKFEPDDLADAMEWDKEPEQLLDALIDVGFIDQEDDGLLIHDWFDYAGRLLEKREQNKIRKQRSRAKSGGNKSGHTPVTRDDSVTDEGVTGLPNQHNQPTIPNQPNHTEQQPTEPEDMGGGRYPESLNLYRIFENEGFGTISPVIADQIADLELTYTARWVYEAMRKAVIKNKRNLSYVSGILKNWKAEGIDEPWTKEKPPNKGGGRNGKQPIDIVKHSEGDSEPVSPEEYDELLRLAERMQSGKQGGGQR